MLKHIQMNQLDNLKEPNFNDYYSPSKDQKNGEMIFTGLTVAGLAYGVSKTY